MNLPRVRVAAVWTISAWPAINYLQSNWHAVMQRGMRSIAGIVMITLAVGLLGHLLHRVATRKGRGGFLVVAWLVAMALLFGYSTISQLSEFLWERYELRIPAMVAWIGLVLMIAGVVVYFRKSEKLQAAAMTFGVVAGGTSVALLLMAMVTYRPVHDEHAAEEAAFVAKPARLPGLNVYYIILDAYAGQQALKETTGFDNSGFIVRMAARGFQEASTGKSNYLRTIHTLGGIFALDYPQTDDPKSWKNSRGLYPDLFDSQRSPELIQRMNAAGYAAWHSATVWGGCAHRHLNCLGAPLLLEPDYMTQTFLAPTPFGRPLMMLVGEQDNAFRSITSRLPTLLSTQMPFFVFAHHMAPHPPFMQDENCLPRNVAADNWNGWDKGQEQAYVNSIKCVNAQVERLVDVIVRMNPNALIVLQGDHGSAFSVEWEKPLAKWSATSIRERGSFLNLIRAPVDCKRWLDQPLGQIYSARFVVACVEGRAPVYLPERTYIATYSNGREKGALRLAP